MYLQAARTSKDELELQERANDALKRDVDRYQRRADLEAEVWSKRKRFPAARPWVYLLLARPAQRSVNIPADAMHTNKQKVVCFTTFMHSNLHTDFMEYDRSQHSPTSWPGSSTMTWRRSTRRRSKSSRTICSDWRVCKRGRPPGSNLASKKYHYHSLPSFSMSTVNPTIVVNGSWFYALGLELQLSWNGHILQFPLIIK